MAKYYTLQLILLFYCLIAPAQTIYYSKANATDFNDVASWGTAENGTGTAPAAISNANEFVISNGSVMTLTADATVRRLTINSGSLTVSAFTLNLEVPNTKQSKLMIDGGTFTVTGGTVNIGGGLHHKSGYFNQSGGSIIIDPNYFGYLTASYSGFAATTLRLVSPTPPSWTGGIITIVDPPVNNGLEENYSIRYSSSESFIASPNHTLRFGNGVSADSGGTENLGFLIDNPGADDITFGNIEIYGPSANGRHVKLEDNLLVNNNFTIFANAKLINGQYGVSVGGNINIHPGASWLEARATFSKRIISQWGFSISDVSPNPQTVTIQPGAIVQSSLVNPTTNFLAITINNSSAEGVSFTGTSPIPGQPAGTISLGNIAFQKGKASGTSDISAFILGWAGNSSQASFQDGGFASGTILGKWYSNTLGGIQFVPGTDGLATNFFTFPFVDNTGKWRTIYIDRVNPVNAQGIIAVKYENIPGTSSINVTDFSATPNYTVNTKGNDTWAVSTLAGTPLAADSFKVQIVAPGLFDGTLTSPNTRVMRGENFVGTHQLGTITPGGHRLNLTAAQLTAAPFTLAVHHDDVLASDDFDKPGFAAYPNPVEDVLNVSHTSAITAVQVYNQLGQQVLSKDINAQEIRIDMSGLAGGIYLVNIVMGNESKTVKIVKR